MCKPKIVLSFLYVLRVKFFGYLIPLIVFLVKFSLGAVFYCSFILTQSAILGILLHSGVIRLGLP